MFAGQSAVTILLDSHAALLCQRPRANVARFPAIFVELDTPEGVRSGKYLDQAGRWDYTVKVYPNAPVNTRHDRMAFRQSQ